MPNEDEILDAPEAKKPSKSGGLPEGWDLNIAYPEQWTVMSRYMIERKQYTSNVFATEAEAQEYCNDQNYGMRLSKTSRDYLRPALVTVAHREWLSYNFVMNVTHPVWNNHDFWRRARSQNGILTQHYTRVSANDSNLLAYYSTPTRACLGQLTDIKPGRYLTKFFGDVLNDKQIKALVEWQATGRYRDPAFADAKLLFAKTADEIERVYVDGPSSCMSYSAGHFRSSVHPVRVYAAGDLAVAYFEGRRPAYRSDTTMRPLARALCWPAKKVFGRIYPNEGSYTQDGFESVEQSLAAKATLEALLRDVGYVNYNEHETGFEGARLVRIEHNSRGTLVMPYVDNTAVQDNGDRLYLSDDGDIGANETNGLSTDSDTDTDYTCEYCEEQCDETYTVCTRTGERGEGRRAAGWCEHCRDHYAFYCEGVSDYFDNDVDNVEVDGRTYTLAYAQAHFKQCDHCEEWSRRALKPVLDRDNSHQMWCDNCVDNDTFTCVVTGFTISNDAEHDTYAYVWFGVDKDTLKQWLVHAGVLQEGDEAAEDANYHELARDDIAPVGKAWVAKLRDRDSGRYSHCYWDGREARRNNTEWSTDRSKAAEFLVKPSTVPQVLGGAERHWVVDWVLEDKHGFVEWRNQTTPAEPAAEPVSVALSSDEPHPVSLMWVARGVSTLTAVRYYWAGRGKSWRHHISEAKQYDQKPDVWPVPELHADYRREWLLVPSNVTREDQIVRIEEVRQEETV